MKTTEAPRLSVSQCLPARLLFFLWSQWNVAWETAYSHPVAASGRGCTLSHTLGFWIHAGDFCMCFLIVVVRPPPRQKSLLEAAHWRINLTALFLSCRSVVLPPGAESALPHSNWLPQFRLPLRSPWPWGPNRHSNGEWGAAEPAAGGRMFLLLFFCL